MINKINTSNTSHNLIRTSSLGCNVSRCLKLAMPFILACSLIIGCQDSTPKSEGLSTDMVKSREIITTSTTDTMQAGGQTAKEDKAPSVATKLKEKAEGVGPDFAKKNLSKIPEVTDGEIEIIPPEYPGGRGVTLAEVEALAQVAPKTDPSQIEVIPPEKPGEPGVTQAEVEAMAKGEDTTDPDLEVIPPEKPGERGVTAGEMAAMAEGSDEKLDPNLEVIPPEKPGQRGVTQAEIEAMEKVRAKLDPNLELVPPDEKRVQGNVQSESKASKALKTE